MQEPGAEPRGSETRPRVAVRESPATCKDVGRAENLRPAFFISLSRVAASGSTSRPSTSDSRPHGRQPPTTNQRRPARAPQPLLLGATVTRLPRGRSRDGRSHDRHGRPSHQGQRIPSTVYVGSQTRARHGRRALAADLQRRRLRRRLLARRRRARAATHTAAESRGAARRRRGGSARLLRLPNCAPGSCARPTRSNASTRDRTPHRRRRAELCAVVGEDAATSAR
jgi:hypothetical protein